MIHLRPFKKTDIQSAQELFYNTVHTINKKDYSQKQRDIWAPQKGSPSLTKSLETHHSYVAEINNTLVGFANLTSEGLIHLLYVHKDYQGRGIAKALLKQLEGKAKELRFQKVTTHANITAQPFFKKQGFVVMKKQNVIKNGVNFINFGMEKKV